MVGWQRWWGEEVRLDVTGVGIESRGLIIK